MNVKKVDSYF